MLSFLKSFKTRSDSNGIYERAARWYLSYFMKEPAKATLSYSIGAGEQNHTHKEGKLKTYSGVFNCILETYATDDAISEAIPTP